MKPGQQCGPEQMYHEASHNALLETITVVLLSLVVLHPGIDHDIMLAIPILPVAIPILSVFAIASARMKIPFVTSGNSRGDPLAIPSAHT